MIATSCTPFPLVASAAVADDGAAPSAPTPRRGRSAAIVLGWSAVLALLVMLLVTLSPPHVVGEGRRAMAAVLASLAPPTKEWGQMELELLGNLVLFVPLGVLGVLVLGPRRAAWVVVAGIMGSAVIEVVQTWLPGRVSDPVDVLLNTAGTALGATIGAAAVGARVLARWLLSQSTADRTPSRSTTSPAR